MSKKITIKQGPCAVESEKQIWDMTHKGSLVRDIAAPYNIDVQERGGPWKPRTKYLVQNNGDTEYVFEGTGVEGLGWFAEATRKYGMHPVLEIMHADALKYVYDVLDPENATLQVGARTSQAFALLAFLGLTPYDVIVKNPIQGVDPEEAIGSLQRITHPSSNPITITEFYNMLGIRDAPLYDSRPERVVGYYTRGQKWPIDPSGVETPEFLSYVEALAKRPDQHPDSRNLNNIGAIRLLREMEYFAEHGIKLGHDPSHTWGGETHQMRRNIGEYALRAIKEYGYDWVMVEVSDKSKVAKCDGDQALFTTLNGIDWDQTHGGEPPEELKPITLVDIVEELMLWQVQQGNASGENLEADIQRLQAIRWDAAA